jgi:hypothetical protein
VVAGPCAQCATPPRKTFEVAESDFKPLPGTKPTIMYYDIKGSGMAWCRLTVCSQW